MAARSTPYPFDDGDAPNRIREWRRRKGWTQEELGARINELFPERPPIGKHLISEWETGKTGGGLMIENLRAAAAALGVATADLLAAQDNPWPLTAEEKEVFELIRRIPDARQREETMTALASLARSMAPRPLAPTGAHKAG